MYLLLSVALAQTPGDGLLPTPPDQGTLVPPSETEGHPNLAPAGEPGNPALANQGEPGGPPMPDGTQLAPSERRPMVVRLEDPYSRFVGTPIIKIQQGSQAITYDLVDTGTGPDARAGDRLFAALASVDPNAPFELSLYADKAEGDPVKSGQVTLDANEKSLQAVFRMGAGGVEIDTRPDPPPLDAPPEDPSVQAPDKPKVDGPQAPEPDHTPLVGARRVTEEAPFQLNFALLGAVVLGLIGSWWGLRRWMAWRLLLAPSSRPIELFGVALPPKGAVAWVLPDDLADEVMVSAIEDLAAQTGVLLVGRRAVEGLRCGHVWQLRRLRPEPGQVVRACKVAGAGVLVLEGPEAIEAPLADEGPAAVVEELVPLLRAPALLILRPNEAIPKGVEVIPFLRSGEELVGGGRSLVRRDGRWRAAPLPETT
jgi:hypothetical protein